MMDETPPLPRQTAKSGGNLPEFSVSEISGLLKRTLEDAFPYVRVRGELSRVNRHSSGHCYFDLKDDKSVIGAVVWKTSFGRLAVKPEQGLEVVCIGRISTFPGQSKYQLIVEQIELAGRGALMAMLEERKRRLAAEGLFDSERKKPLPFLPQIVGVITSPTGAVIRDIMHRLADRCPRHVLLWPVTVQGDRAPAEIVAAIRGFNNWNSPHIAPRPDVLIVARGGGSFEDLLAFSDEAVVRAAAASVIPLISAVGHETDTTLIDFAADRRAPTPTAAAEMAVPVLRDLVGNLIAFEQRLYRGTTRGFDQRRRSLAALARALPRADALLALSRQRFDASAERLRGSLFQNLQRHATALARTASLLRPRLIAGEIVRSRDGTTKLHARLRRALVQNLQAHSGELARAAAQLRPRLIEEEIAQGRSAGEKLEARLRRAYGHRVQEAARGLESCGRVLESVSYRAVLERGFTLVRGADGKLRRRASLLKPAERLVLVFADGEAGATATGRSRPPARTPKDQGNQGNLF
jgi:exodeoxyribonuclease VII large subunit